MATDTKITVLTICKPNYGFTIRYKKRLPKATLLVTTYYFLKQQFKIKYNHGII